MEEIETIELNARQFAEKLYKLSPGDEFYFTKNRGEKNSHNWIGVQCACAFGRRVYIVTQNVYGGYLKILCDEVQCDDDDFVMQIQNVFNSLDMRYYVDTVYAFDKDDADYFDLMQRVNRRKLEKGI